MFNSSTTINFNFATASTALLNERIPAASPSLQSELDLADYGSFFLLRICLLLQLISVSSMCMIA